MDDWRRNDGISTFCDAEFHIRTLIRAVSSKLFKNFQLAEEHSCFAFFMFVVFVAMMTDDV
jgi:hypothetical protein